MDVAQSGVRPAVLLATGDEAVRFVLSDLVLSKGVALAIAYHVHGILDALKNAGSLRLLFYTPDALGAAALDAAQQLRRNGLVFATIPTELRQNIAGLKDLERSALWRSLTYLLDAVRQGLVGTTMWPPLQSKPGTPHSQTASSPILSYGPISVDLSNDHVYVDGTRNTDITGQPLHVLKYLLARPGTLIRWDDVDVTVREAIRSPEAHRQIVHRLRIALKRRRDMVVTERGCVGIRVPRSFSR